VKSKNQSIAIERAAYKRFDSKTSDERAVVSSDATSFTEGKQVEVNKQFFASTVSIASALAQRDGKRSSQSGMVYQPSKDQVCRWLQNGL
jgi:hypothetical protein